MVYAGPSSALSDILINDRPGRNNVQEINISGEEKHK